MTRTIHDTATVECTCDECHYQRKHPQIQTRVAITVPKMTNEVSELRDAVLFLVDAYYSRRDQDLVVAAFRRVANDTSKPFSEEAVTIATRSDGERLRKYDELVDKLARDYNDTSGSISRIDAIQDTVKELVAVYEAAKL